MGRPLRRVLRSGACVGPGAGLRLGPRGYTPIADCRFEIADGTMRFHLQSQIGNLQFPFAFLRFSDTLCRHSDHFLSAVAAACNRVCLVPGHSRGKSQECPERPPVAKSSGPSSCGVGQRCRNYPSLAPARHLLITPTEREGDGGTSRNRRPQLTDGQSAREKSIRLLRLTSPQRDLDLTPMDREVLTHL
jgi:hypothetical protein